MDGLSRDRGAGEGGCQWVCEGVEGRGREYVCHDGSRAHGGEGLCGEEDGGHDFVSGQWGIGGGGPGYGAMGIKRQGRVGALYVADFGHHFAVYYEAPQSGIHGVWKNCGKRVMQGHEDRRYPRK